MENLIKKHHTDKQLGLGIAIIAIGSIFLLRNSGFDLPHWLFSWHTILLAIGLWFGYRNDFKSGSWIAMVIIGGIFTLRDISLFDFHLSRITVPMLLIGWGLYFILKPKKVHHFPPFEQKQAANSASSKK